MNILQKIKNNNSLIGMLANLENLQLNYEEKKLYKELYKKSLVEKCEDIIFKKVKWTERGDFLRGEFVVLSIDEFVELEEYIIKLENKNGEKIK